MQLVILAGGKGTRLSEETVSKPKPLVEIGGMPIIWHIMKIYSFYGVNEFIICCGYKGYLLKEFFANYYLHTSDSFIDVKKNKIKSLNNKSENWKITLVDTGLDTQTGGRLLRVKKYLKKTFCMTYGDGLSDVNIKNLINFHKKNKKDATMTVVKPSARFGAVELKDHNKISKFVEKPKSDGGWINGGFFVLNKQVLNFIDSDQTLWEKEPLEKIAKKNQLMAYKHDKFWQPMDTLREKDFLEHLWNSGNAPWKKW